MNVAARFKSGDLVRTLWICWILVLPFAHLTGLRNVLATICILMTLLTFGVQSLRDLPGKFAVLSLCSWATISLWWSAEPSETWSHLKDDLVVGVLAYAAAFVLVIHSDMHLRLLQAFAAAVALLTFVASFALVPADWFSGLLPVRYDAALNRLMPIWYPGMGDSSMFGALCIAPILLLATLRVSQRWIATATVLLFIGALITRNRANALILPLAIGFYCFLCGLLPKVYHRSPISVRTDLRKYFILMLVSLLLALSLAELICHERFTLAGKPAPLGGKHFCRYSTTIPGQRFGGNIWRWGWRIRWWGWDLEEQFQRQHIRLDLTLYCWPPIQRHQPTHTIFLLTFGCKLESSEWPCAHG